MPRAAQELLRALQDCVDGDPPRAAHCADAALKRIAEHGIRRLPLVHRTGRQAMGSILGAGKLQPTHGGSREEQSLGLSPSVYFFFGSASYPKGYCAIFLPVKAVEEESIGQFSPFDSGSLSPPPRLFPRDSGARASWSDGAFRSSLLDQYTGYARDLIDFACHYVFAHFEDPRDYVRREQISEPDYTPYHGLASESGDRRAWTIEVRVSREVAVTRASLAGIAVNGVDLLDDIVGDEYHLSTVVLDRQSVSFDQQIADYLLAQIPWGVA